MTRMVIQQQHLDVGASLDSVFFYELIAGFNVRPDDSGHYTCDECKKVFKHPGSLQHHRHIHKGTHKYFQTPDCHNFNSGTEHNLFAADLYLDVRLVEKLLVEGGIWNAI